MRSRMVKKMNRQARRMIAVGMCLLMFGSMLGCAGTNENKVTEQTQSSETIGWKKYAAEQNPVTLNWYINYSWFPMDWGKNMVSKQITKDTGVNINFVTPAGNQEETINALVASDSLPDIVTLGWWEPQINDMIKNKMVYALNELADQYDPYFYEVTDPTVVNWYSDENGDIYGYPNSAYTPEAVETHSNIGSNQTFLVRKDIYEAIGSPDMTTQEGFEAAVKKAVEMYPEVDGKSLIPIGSHIFEENGCNSFDNFLMNFLAVPYEKDGKLYDRHTDPEYLSWLKFFRKLGEEGYLSSDIFVDQRTQMNEKVAEGRYFCMLYQRTDIADQESTLYEKNPDSIYIAVDGPKNSKGDDYVLPTNTINGWTLTLISKNCKHPDRAIAFLDYMMSEEGQKMISLGVEGEMYDMVDEKAVLKDDVRKLLTTDRKKYDELYGADDAYWMLQNNVMQLDWMPEKQYPLNQMEEWTYPYTRYLGEYEVTKQDDSEMSRINSRIDKLWGKTLPRLLLAKSDEEFDQLFETFVEERETLGYSQLVKEHQKTMEENKKRLGME
ncbi:MAG: extracellular solute-binding protein [Lachnobacterium sp.]|nr:extracellular solute-binding protein [Lachnobacterium sp.]